MRILVTGGTGFLGSHLCERLLELGHDVVALDNMVTQVERPMWVISRPQPVSSWCMPICAKESRSMDASNGFSICNSPASPIDYVELPFETLYVGSDGTRHVLERAESDGARVMLASTSEVYGDPAVHPQVESYWGNVNPIGPPERIRRSQAVC